jgi:VanZ family protein
MTAMILIAGWSALALGIVAGCLVPADRLPPYLPNDKLLHLVSYAVLALPVAMAASSSQQVVAGAVILLGAGLAIEFVQHFIPGRSFCTRDLLANAVGVVIGTVLGLGV